MDGNVGLPFWLKMNYWMDCHDSWFTHPWSVDDVSYSLKIQSHNTLEDVKQKYNFAMDSVSCALAYIFVKPVFVYILADWRH